MVVQVPVDWQMGLGMQPLHPYSPPPLQPAWAPATPAARFAASPGGVVQAPPLEKGAVIEIDFSAATMSAGTVGSTAGVSGVVYSCLAATKKGGAAGCPQSMIQYTVDGQPGTLRFTYVEKGGAATETFELQLQGSLCVANPAACAEHQTLPCATGQVTDLVTGQCVPPCTDGSAPSSGVCSSVKATGPVTAPAATPSGVSTTTVLAATAGAAGLGLVVYLLLR